MQRNTFQHYALIFHYNHFIFIACTLEKEAEFMVSLLLVLALATEAMLSHGCKIYESKIKQKKTSFLALTWNLLFGYWLGANDSILS